MKRRLTILLIVLGTLCSFGQVSVYDIKQYQYGNTPGYVPEYEHSYYEQLHIKYRWKRLRFHVGVEGAYAQDTLVDDYVLPTKYVLSYRKKGFSVKAGTFYETIGNGLLLRGYEIKNAVFQDPVYRVKQGFYKDFLGVSTSYRRKMVSIKALTGKLQNNQLPPMHEDRRTDWVYAGEFGLNVKQQNVGLGYLYNTNTVDSVHFVSLMASGTVFKSLSYKGEIAHKLSDTQYFSTNGSYAAYGSVSYAFDRVAMSMEIKDYHKMFIGSGVSDPPTLVKEHSYKLLNRSTHIVDLEDETGLQFEAFYKPAKMHFFTLNYTNVINRIYRDFWYNELFLEWKMKHSRFDVKLMVDYAQDELNFERDRVAGGLAVSMPLRGKWNCTVEGEYQYILRELGQVEEIDNVYVGLIVNRSSRFSAALQWEFTNDSFKSDNPTTKGVEEKRHFPGVTLSYNHKRYHSFQLFAGERLGGPACTAGICYEVPDFKGVEIRWNVKI